MGRSAGCRMARRRSLWKTPKQLRWNGTGRSQGAVPLCRWTAHSPNRRVSSRSAGSSSKDPRGEATPRQGQGRREGARGLEPRSGVEHTSPRCRGRAVGIGSDRKGTKGSETGVGFANVRIASAPTKLCHADNIESGDRGGNPEAQDEGSESSSKGGNAKLEGEAGSSGGTASQQAMEAWSAMEIVNRPEPQEIAKGSSKRWARRGLRFAHQMGGTVVGQ